MLEKIFVTQGLDLIRFHDLLQAPKLIKLDRNNYHDRFQEMEFPPLFHQILHIPSH